MFIRILLLLLGSFVCCFCQATAASYDALQSQNQQVLKKEIAVQEQADQWSAAKQALVNDLLDQKTQLEWNRFQNKKYQQYLAHKQQAIADLQRRQEIMGKLRMELEPFLDYSIEKLQSLILEDLPFLTLERQERMDFLAQSLADPDLKLSEKLRRLLEAVQVEADYGNSVEVSEEKLALNNENTIVQVLRLGRIGLFYLTQDNANVGRWDPEQKQWLPITDDYAPTVQKTMDVVRQKRVAELVDLPLPKFSQVSGEAKQ